MSERARLGRATQVAAIVGEERLQPLYQLLREVA